MPSDALYPRYDHAVACCLRAAVWAEPCPQSLRALLQEKDFWKAAYRQSCGHLLAVWALDNHLIDAGESLKIQVFAIYQRTMRQNRLLTDLLTLFGQHDIPAVLLKGYGLSLLYPSPEMREYGDIDLYIGEQNYDRATAFLRASFPDAYWFSEEYVGHHFLMQLDANRDLVAEFHNIAMDLPGMPRAEKAFNDFCEHELTPLRTVRLNETDIPIPSVRFNSLYVFVHAWHHFENNGVGLRQLADWMLCLHQLAHTLTEEERQTFEAELKGFLQQMSMLDIWQTFGCVLVAHLGLSKAEFPLYRSACEKRGERLYRQILHDGHGYRFANRQSGAIIHTFPLRRPEHNRLLQRLYTALRIPYDAFQLAKIFPRLAFRRFCGNIRLGFRRLFSRRYTKP